jgi:hypothetical protein
MGGEDAKETTTKPLWQATQWTLLDCVRISILSCLVVYCTQGLYAAYYGAFMARFNSERWFLIVSTVLVHETLYYGYNALLYWFSQTAAAEEYRLPRQKHQQPAAQLIRKTLIQSAISHWLIQPLSLYLLYPTMAVSMRILPLRMSLDSFGTIIWQFSVSILINDACKS